VIHFKDGTTKEDTQSLVKEKGRWKETTDKAESPDRVLMM
jgi:hypothetical protein